MIILLVFYLQNATVTSEEKIIQKKVEQLVPKKQIFLKETPRDVHTGEYLETVEKCTDSLSKVEIGQRPGRTAYVSHIESPGKFWIQLVENEQSINDIDSELMDIEIETNSKYLLDGPLIVGQLYAVKHREFGNCGLILYLPISY